MAASEAALRLRPETTASLSSSSEILPSRQKEKNRTKYKEQNDPLRVLDPVRKKLSMLESQRIMAAMEENIRRVEIVTLLPFITENLERYAVLLGSDLVSALEEHGKLQADYQKCIAKLKRTRSSHGGRSRTSSLAESEQHGEIEAHVQAPSDDGSRPVSATSAASETAVDRKQSIQSTQSLSSEEFDSMVKVAQTLQFQLQISVKTVLRLFSYNPSAVNSIRQERKERSYESNCMIDEMIALKSMVFEKLLITPGEERERDQYLTSVMERERKSSELVRKLKAELEAAIEDKDSEISKRNDIIRKLKNDIYSVDKNSEDQNHRVITDAAKAETSELKNSEDKKAKLQQEVIEIKKSFESDTATHRESELILRKKKYKIETELENWIQKYDNDMGERQDEFDALDAVYTEEKKQLNELEERFKTLEKEYLQIIEERRIAKERAEQAERELQAKIRACRLIQAFWRAHKARKGAKKKGKKGKKGKKSGKKKKKK